MIIDSHVHLTSEPGYTEKLLKECDRLGIDKVCLLAMQNTPFWGYRAASNEQVLNAYSKYPDRIIPFCYIDLGIDSPTLVDELFMKGAKGLKFTRPRFDYNADRLMEYYERAARYNLVLLFHTGTVLRTPDDHLYDVDCSRMRPIFLDRIARRYPTVKIIGAHLGNPWYEEAAMTLFWNENMYFDLSGTTLKRKNASWFNETLWWTPEKLNRLATTEDTFYANKGSKHPFERICFGSDVPINEMGIVMEEYKKLFDDLQLEQGIRDRVMGGNIAEMFGLK